MNIQENVASLLFYVLNKSNSVGPCVYDINPKCLIDLSSVGRQDGIPLWKNMLSNISDDYGKELFKLLHMDA